MKPKVLITIALDDSGNVSLQATSNNLVTILGMIELGREILLKNKRVEEPSNIVVPDNGVRRL